MTLETFLTPDQQQQVVEAIEKAEKETSGEIRVHIESECVDADAYARAIAVFNELGMYNTRLRNGVLIYIAFRSHCFAIIGDKGIYDITPTDFWSNERSMLGEYLSAGNATDGLCKVIEAIGLHLKSYFPYQDDDINEQPNEISYGK